MTARTAVEIKPIDIRRIRQSLALSQKRMGESLSNYMQGPGSNPIPGSRVNEWEMGVRAIPDQVFMACAGILVDTWAAVRDKKGEQELGPLDSAFANLLSPALAAAIALEAEFRNRRDKEGARIFLKAQQVRLEVQKYLESLLMISMAKIKFEQMNQNPISRKSP